MWWAENQKKELTPKEVKELPAGTTVHLEGRNRRGEVYYLDGRVCDKNGIKKFLYYENRFPEIIEIKTYKGKKWMVRKDG